MNCPKCGSEKVNKSGFDHGKQRYRCSECNHRFVLGGSKQQVFTKSKKNMGISVEQFRKKHDVVYILSLVPQKFEEGVVYEKSDIIRMANLSAGFAGIGTVLESEEWKKYTGRAGGKTWYGSPELITKLKEEGIMR